jgi:ADP-ribose pyrophosphatase YjhB (NUDIX family)
MRDKITMQQFLNEGAKFFLPSVSIDNVVFGFCDDQIRVLLLKLRYSNKWALPGGFVYRKENIDDAATRILKTRTGLKNLFLQQFHVFGEAGRTNKKLSRKFFEAAGVENMDKHWLTERFISIGYYALVDYKKVSPQPDEFSEECRWWKLTELPPLIFDHKEIAGKALHTLRLQLNTQPVGYNLLPKEFTLKNLQTVYETILGKKLDRSNFNRKILSYDMLDKKEKHYSGDSHKAPYLYSFNKQKYFKILQHG